nr:immunoglobulin heavy chain junction region [Mus musculus]
CTRGAYFYYFDYW